MVGSRLVAHALADALGVEPYAVGAPRPALWVAWDVELEAARDELILMGERYSDLLAAGLTPVTALSRCAVALATLPVVARHRPDALVVWFDAHPDLNTPDTTTSGYLGGLALSGPLGLWDSGLGAGLSLDHTILVGTRDIDPAEAEVLTATTLTVLAPGPDLPQQLVAAVAGRPVYIHVDCDVLNPGIVLTGSVVPDGLSLGDLRSAAVALSRSPTVGIEIGELESSAGVEDLAPLFEALSPVLDPLR